MSRSKAVRHLVAAVLIASFPAVAGCGLLGGTPTSQIQQMPSPSVSAGSVQSSWNSVIDLYRWHSCSSGNCDAWLNELIASLRTLRESMNASPLGASFYLSAYSVLDQLTPVIGTSHPSEHRAQIVSVVQAMENWMVANCTGSVDCR